MKKKVNVLYAGLLLTAGILLAGCCNSHAAHEGCASAFYLIGLGTGFVSFITGCLWYSVFFGKKWQRLMEFSDEKVKSILTPQRIFIALIAELVASVCVTLILHHMSARIPLAACAAMLIVVIVAYGIKRTVFDEKSHQTVLIDGGYATVTILLFFGSLTLFGKYIAF
jgi:hypothetical protein